MSKVIPELEKLKVQAPPAVEAADLDPLEKQAHRLALEHTVAPGEGHGTPLLDRLQALEASLGEAYRKFAETTHSQTAQSLVAEWMLDNYHVVNQTVRQIREDMPRGYYQRLPKLAGPEQKGLPRVYALGVELVRLGESRLALDQLVCFVEAYQERKLLTIGEVWAIPIMLRLAILESLAQAVERDDETRVAHCFRSLLMLATEDWKAFFERTNQVDKVLRQDPAGVYARMDFTTRDRYRQVVEELAVATGLEEAKVAGAAVHLAQEHPESHATQGLARPLPAPLRHVGYYLLDQGRAQLESMLKYSPDLGTRLSRWAFRHATLIYLGAIILVMACLDLLLTAYAQAAGGTQTQVIGAALLGLLPFSAVAVELVNQLVTRAVHPRLLPKMDFQGGIPPEFRAIVVVPALLRDEQDVNAILRQLEQHYLGNTDPHLYFALLSDFDDAPEQNMPDDEALLARARSGIQALNQKYSQDGKEPFYLFHRRRVWNAGEACWMGSERKRGKLAEFNRLLFGSRDTTFIEQSGDLAVLPHLRYVITLDADTILPREAAWRLVATLAHPLNQAVFDAQGEEVVSGYTLLQPRLQVKPSIANRSLFRQVFSGDIGLDLYTRAVSDVYQDLFGEGNYVGKGIYDIAAFERSLSGRVPENTLLSHDLFEGLHGRVGLVTDVALYEDYPPHYLAYVQRLHRWVRGDWQLLPWLLPRVPAAGGTWKPNRLSPIDRWKILDNLRRSLMSPALLALLVASWLWLPGFALVWIGIVLAVLALPLLPNLRIRLFRRPDGNTAAPSAQPFRLKAIRCLLMLVFLPHEALASLDAILTTLWRMLVIHRRMLQWVTAAHTTRFLGRQLDLAQAWRQMMSSLAFVLGLGVLVGWVVPHHLPLAALFLLAWLAAPYIAYRLSRPIQENEVSLSPAQHERLRGLARRTWLYFEQFVTPEDNWLPPDHYQEDPRGLVAHHTSPTNIGLMLLSTLAAYDLGYIGPNELYLRLRVTLDSMNRLERQWGHFFNWYDTRSLQVLTPRYISVVDSGNLAGCLLALRQGCFQIPKKPTMSWPRWQGLLDSLDILVQAVEQSGLGGAGESLLNHIEQMKEHVQDGKQKSERWAWLLVHLLESDQRELEMKLASLVAIHQEELDATQLRNLRIWVGRLRQHLYKMRRALETYLPWQVALVSPPALFAQANPDLPFSSLWEAFLSSLPTMPSLEAIPEVCQRGQDHLRSLRDALSQELAESASPSPQAQGDQPPAAAVSQADPELAGQIQEARLWCTRLMSSMASARQKAEELVAGYLSIANQAEGFVLGMNFSPLYDSHRQVFHLGFNVDSGALDNTYYDLLASEARLASLLAIAKGDIPQSHWLYLARPLTQVDGRRALLSWSGTLFEYLMPSLLVRDYPNSLIHQSNQVAVDYQIAYGHKKGLPWGISESGFYLFDSNLNYQYRAFGAPGLGFKRGLANDLVVAPYASLLALPLRAQAVLENLSRLDDLQGLGLYGYYEAIDFTPSRLPQGQEQAVVRSFMSHHAGMILLSLVNYLNGDVMRQRFHTDSRIQSVDLLLQEQVPEWAPVEYPRPEEVSAAPRIRPRTALDPWRPLPGLELPQVHCLSNGRYNLVLSHTGSSYSWLVEHSAKGWQEVDLTRWRNDPTLDNWGSWIYIQDLEKGYLWSAAPQPVNAPAESQAVQFYPNRIEFSRRDHEISSRMEVTVSPTEDVEIRRLTLTNHSDQARRIRLTSYAEVALAPHVADLHHMAFQKLFVESEYIPEVNALCFYRRPRSADDPALVQLHMVVTEDSEEPASVYETSRGRFLGRGGNPRSPAALSQEHDWGKGLTGPVLDPVMSLSHELELEPHPLFLGSWLRPHSDGKVVFITLVAPSREKALALARTYRVWSNIERTFDQARQFATREFQQYELSTPELERIQRLLSAMLYPYPRLRAAPERLSANRKGQPDLWPYAISGDYPILLVRVNGPEETGLVEELLRAHAYWRRHGIRIDLVILNLQALGYEQELASHLALLVDRAGPERLLNQRGGIFILQADRLDESARILLEASARAILDGSRGSLAEQLQVMGEKTVRLPERISLRQTLPPDEPLPALERPASLLFDNGLGGFSPDGREYVIYLEPGNWTPVPWVNVIANPQFGCLVSETGLGSTWSENSSENRLTVWRNDPVRDTPAEAIYLRDEESGEAWTPTPLPVRASAPYLVHHGAGYSRFEHHSHGLIQQLLVYVIPDAPVKVVRLRLKNAGRHVRRIVATYYAEWVLGTFPDAMRPHILPEFDADHQALLARNPYQVEFGERVAFLTASREAHGISTDRTEFLGFLGDDRNPAALNRVGLSSTVQAGLDPCAAFQVLMWINPGQTKEVVFLMGQGKDRQEALELASRYREMEQIETAWKAVNQSWDEILGAVCVDTPDPAMNLLLNRWLLYQTLASRIWGRNAFYQSSGAFGFRDQLQDVMALVHNAPGIAREHLLRAARYQFEAGDVLHWWHPPSGRGIRSRCSDDLLWLPLVTAHYVFTTGDSGVLDEKVPFLVGPPLGPGEEERYSVFAPSDEAFTLFEHCCRALEKGDTIGPHQLPLMGTGDWNDGMNRVGVKGRGESIWLGWFLYTVLDRFAGLCEQRGETERASGYRIRMDALKKALEAHAWDGQWYLRAYFDDGTPLGSAESQECQIDSLPQSWAVLSGAADPDRAAQAMESAYHRLVLQQDRLVLLFTPPFDKTRRNPGYIQGYLPGIRENGGQYTHAAIWMAWAFARLGQGERAGELFRMLNPIQHAQSLADVGRYQVEPYVMAADVYSLPPNTGRGGWTWYSGSASWMYRLGLEAILGLQREGPFLRLDPCISKDWKEYQLTVKHNGTVYQIKVCNPGSVNRGVVRVTLDGRDLPDGRIPLLEDGGTHPVEVEMG